MYLLTNINLWCSGVSRSARLSDEFSWTPLGFHAYGTTIRRTTFKVQCTISIIFTFVVAIAIVSGNIWTFAYFVTYKKLLCYIRSFLGYFYLLSLQIATKSASSMEVLFRFRSIAHCVPSGQSISLHGSRHLHPLHSLSSTNASIPYGHLKEVHSSNLAWHSCGPISVSFTAVISQIY